MTVRSGFINAMGGDAVNLTNSNLDVTLDSVTSTDSSNVGILLSSVDGNFAVTDATTIDNPNGAGITVESIFDPGPRTSTVSFGTVDITNRQREAIVVNNMNGASLQFGQTTIGAHNGAFDEAIRIEFSDATMNFTGDVTITDSLAQGFMFTGNTGNFGVTGNIMISDTVNEAIDVDNNTGSFTLNGGTISTLLAVIRPDVNIENTSIVNLNGLTIDGQFSRGIEIDQSTNGNMDVTLTNNVIMNTLQEGILARARNGSVNGTLNLTLTNNTMSAPPPGIDGIRVSEADTNDICLNATGNTRTGGFAADGLFVDQTGAGNLTVRATSAANLTAINNGSTVRTNGTITFTPGASCP